MGKQSKLWSPGVLKGRGWTKGLMDHLLPKPRWRRWDGRSVPCWRQEDVLAAEATAAFQAGAQKKEPKPPARGADRGAVLAAQALLDGAWQSACPGEGEVWRLAELFHRAVLHGLASASGGLRRSQVTGYLRQFLALGEKGCQSSQLPGLLTHFARGAVWMGANPTAPLTAQGTAGYVPALVAGAEAAVEDFRQAQPQADLAAFLGREDFPVQQLLSRGVGTVYSVWYVPQAIRKSLSALLALHPKDEYPRAREMRRHFVLHLGGTNTGKTYAGFQRLIAAPTGVYLAPLRLLALEAQETLLDAGVDCALTTGEEEDCREGDTHVAATAEKLDLGQPYDVAVIDECQMIADRQRGYAWTRAILGVQAPEVHLCAAPEAGDLLVRLVQSCGDSYEIVHHHRKTPLVCMNRTVDYTRAQPGDALITFSKVGVLSVAEELRQAGKQAAILYGALPYATRRRQMEGFLAGEMQYVVATDAIGMGLNLPIRRVIFLDTEKFDGVERRELKPQEIQQIAGRAGRYGMYDKGYAGASQNLALIRAGLETVVPPLQEAVLGFSELVLQVDFDLLEVLTQWSQMPTVDPYVKLDISRYLTLIAKIREKGFRLSKEEELRAANIPFDETEEPLADLFFRFLRLRLAGEELPRPELPEGEGRTLPELELYCRKLDLYFSFAKAFGCPVDQQALYDRREEVAEEINEILLHRLKNNIRFCPVCGKALPLKQRGRLCEACYRRQHRGRNR
ncbi:helicase-related protein [Evtepia sp.]